MKTYVTADLHFSHEVMITELGRPFKTTSEMNRVLIRNINRVVGEDDRLFILGDLTMDGPNVKDKVAALVRQIKSKKKILVLGNHDRFTPFQYLDMGFYQVVTHYEETFQDRKVWMFHDPAWASIVPRTDLVLCGHVHTLFNHVNNVINVGVDVWDYTPVEFELACSLIMHAGEN